LTTTNISEKRKFKQVIDSDFYQALRMINDNINDLNSIRSLKQAISKAEDNLIFHDELSLYADLRCATKKYDSGTVNGDVYPRGDTIYPGEKYFLVARGGLSRFERIHGTKVKYDYLVDYFNEELEKLHERQGEYNR